MNVRNLTVTDRLLDKIDLFEVSKVVVASFLLALLAQVQIPLGFTPVPVTLQTLGVLLIGSTLGSKKAAMAVGLYIVEGAMGLPFFAGGTFGLAKVMGPSGGYLLGMVIAAYFMGMLSERNWQKEYHSALPLFILGHGIIFIIGMAWLSMFVGWDNAVLMGLLPFIPGAVLKTLAATAIYPSAYKMLNR